MTVQHVPVYLSCQRIERTALSGNYEIAEKRHLFLHYSKEIPTFIVNKIENLVSAISLVLAFTGKSKSNGISVNYFHKG